MRPSEVIVIKPYIWVNSVSYAEQLLKYSKDKAENHMKLYSKIMSSFEMISIPLRAKLSGKTANRGPTNDLYKCFFCVS